MLKELCATLLVLCNPILSGFNFDYAKNDRDQFVQGIAECTIKYNTDINPFERAIVVLSVAQAIIESNWENLALPGKRIIFMALSKRTERNHTLNPFAAQHY